MLLADFNTTPANIGDHPADPGKIPADPGKPKLESGVKCWQNTFRNDVHIQLSLSLHF